MTAPFANRAAGTARTMGRLMFVDPVRAGRLRLSGLPPLVRRLATLGVVALGALLFSLVLNDLWRRGPLTIVRDFEASPNLAAKGVLSFTVISLAVAWVLTLVGGALARPLVAALVGVAFLLFNSGLSDAQTFGETWLLRVLPDVVLVCFFAAPALALALSLLRQTDRWRVLRPVLGIALVVSAAALFGAHLAVYVLEERRGGLVGLPRLLDGTMNGLQSFLVPLFILAVAALVQLNHQVARAVATPFWTVGARMAKVAVLLLIALKLRYSLGGRVDDWSAYLVERRPQAIQALGFLLFVAAAAWLFRQLERLDDGRLDDGSPPAVSTEGVVYAGSLALSTTSLVVGIVLSAASFAATVGWLDLSRSIVENLPATFLSRYLVLSVFGIGFAIGVALLVRPRPAPFDRRMGALLVLLGAWLVPNLVLQQLSARDVGFDIGLVDLALTIAALGWLVVRWRKLDTAGAVRLGALLVFVSLVAGNGYVATRVVSRVLAPFTPPAVLLIVIGVLYVVLADSAFAGGSSRNFPRETRVLLWLGYLIFVVAVTNYVLVAREAEYRIEFDRYAFHLLALPLAVWLAVRGRFEPAGGVEVGSDE